MEKRKIGRLEREIQRRLLSGMGSDGAEALREIARYKREFSRESGYNVYSYGNICPYYSQIRKLYEETGTAAPGMDSALQRHFERAIERAVDALLEGSEGTSGAPRSFEISE